MEITNERLEELVDRARFTDDGRVFYQACIRGVSVEEEHMIARELLARRMAVVGKSGINEPIWREKQGEETSDGKLLWKLQK
jgi:hypothetical protein